jgi:hypothetical protein
MKNPDFKPKLSRLLCVGCVVLAGTLLAESPETGSNRNAASRTKPQVIYHLPPASNYAATLHSQAKGQNNDLPIDSSMPTSLQMSRANANAAAAQQQETATPPPPPQERRVKTRVRSNRVPVQSRSFMKAPGRGNAHGNRSHKK